MRISLYLALLSFVGLALAPQNLRAQQGNLQMLLPPSVDFSREKTRDFGGGYVDAHGSRVSLGGLDVTATFGERKSSSTYNSSAFGVALLGLPNNETIHVYGVTRDLSGICFHGGSTRHYLYGRADGFPRRALFVSVPVSFGSYSIIQGSKEEGKFYNFLVGMQGGAALNLRAGSWLATPSAMLGAMGGYKETYKGGTYFKNMRSGGVRPFGLAALALELTYLPAELRLRTAWQRATGNGTERAVDYVSWTLTMGWGTTHKKPL